MRYASICVAIFTLAGGTPPVSRACGQDLRRDEQNAEREREPPRKSPPPTDAVVDIEKPAASGASSVLSANAELMDRLLITSAQETMRAQKFVGAAGIAGGAILLGLGGWRLAEDPPQTQFTRGLGVMFTTLGAVDFTTGIFVLRRISQEKRRLDRWERAKADGITELELARVEGELLTSSETREGGRMLVRWNGLTHALAGVVVIALTPVPDNSLADRVSGWTIGGIFIASGAVAFGMSFRPTSSEVAWKAYQAGKVTATGRQFSWQMSPSISRHSIGLGLSGAF